MRPDDSTRERGRLERTVRGTAQMLASAADERWMRAWRSCDLVYANSVGDARAMRALGPNAPLLAHVHESSYSLHHTESRADVAAVVGGTHPIIAASRAVASTLTDDFTVSPSRIHVMNSFITLPPPDVPGGCVDSLRESLGIPANAFVVGGMGTIEWRKGADIFVQLAGRLAALRPDSPIHFVWAGASTPTDPLERVRIDIDATKSGAADRIHFAGAQSDPWPFHYLCDAFALTSRAEPLGLVAIEAASMGRPVVLSRMPAVCPTSWPAAAAALPYLGVEEMAIRILELHDNPQLRQTLGQKAAAYIPGRYDAAAIVPQSVSWS